jgi:hypothetical protein
MQRQVGPSSAWAARYALVTLIAAGMSAVASIAAQPASTSNATASGPSAHRGVTKPFTAPRNPGDNKGLHIAPMQPGGGSAPSVISKPPQMKLPSGAAATPRPVVGPHSSSVVSSPAPRTNSPMIFAKPNTGASSAIPKSGVGLAPNPAHMSGTGIGLRGVAPASIRPPAKANAGINGTGIVRKN